MVSSEILVSTEIRDFVTKESEMIICHSRKKGSPQNDHKIQDLKEKPSLVVTSSRPV